MNGTNPISLAVLVPAAALSVPAFAQTAERPEWKYGDRWVFQEHSSPPPAESQWSRKVVVTFPNGDFRVETEANKYLRFDAEGNSLDGRGSEYTWHRFKFPMTVGAKWSYERKINREPHEGTESATWKVVAYEKTTVPAGTFECFRVEGSIYRQWTASTFTAWAHGTETQTYWYCPAVKWAAKWETVTIPYVSSPQIRSASELVSFESQP